MYKPDSEPLDQFVQRKGGSIYWSLLLCLVIDRPQNESAEKMGTNQPPA
jgi:hypothetical protein